MTRRHALNRPWMYKTGAALIRNMPWWFNRMWVRMVADYNYWRLREHRSNVCRNLAPIVGPDRKRQRVVARRLFRHYSEMLVDYARFFGGDGDSVAQAFLRAEGLERIEVSLAEGRGVLLITAHLGFWELGSRVFRERGYPVSVLTLEDPDPGVHEVRSEIRSRLGIETITVGDNPWGGLAVARALRDNRVVAMLVDRYEGPDPVLVRLFGRFTQFAPGPALYARMTGAAVIPAFVLAEGKGRYRGLVQAPLTMRFTDDRAADVLANTQRIADVVGELVSAYPDQWYNFEPIWREP